MFFNRHMWDIALTWDNDLHPEKCMIMSFHLVVHSPRKKMGFKWDKIEVVPQKLFFYLFKIAVFWHPRKPTVLSTTVLPGETEGSNSWL